MPPQRRSAQVELPGGVITVYTRGSRVAAALDELLPDMNLYHGVKFAQVLEAVYEQGIRDGRPEVVESFNDLAESPELAYRNPGRPRTRRR